MKKLISSTFLNYCVGGLLASLFGRKLHPPDQDVASKDAWVNPR